MFLAPGSYVLNINLPQDRLLRARDFIEYWNSGKVLLTKNQTHIPEAVLVFIGKNMGGIGEKAGARVLENWYILNPISDPRVTLKATYLKYAERLKRKIQTREIDLSSFDSLTARAVGTKSQPASLRIDSQQTIQKILEVIGNPEAYGVALDSMFSTAAKASSATENASSEGGGSGKINILNRHNGLCLIKVTSSDVVGVSWNESKFGPMTNAEPVQITVDDKKTEIKSYSSQDVNIINDKTHISVICVDTYDNVQVDVNGIITKVIAAFNERSVLLMALRHLNLLK